MSLSTVDFSIPSIDRIVRGIEIIRKYTDEKYLSAEHDVIYFGDYEETHEKMSEEERALMEKYGWMEMEDSWGFFV